MAKPLNVTQSLSIVHDRTTLATLLRRKLGWTSIAHMAGQRSRIESDSANTSGGPCRTKRFAWRAYQLAAEKCRHYRHRPHATTCSIKVNGLGALSATPPPLPGLAVSKGIPLFIVSMCLANWYANVTNIYTHIMVSVCDKHYDVVADKGTVISIYNLVVFPYSILCVLFVIVGKFTGHAVYIMLLVHFYGSMPTKTLTLDTCRSKAKARNRST